MSVQYFYVTRGITPGKCENELTPGNTRGETPECANPDLTPGNTPGEKSAHTQVNTPGFTPGHTKNTG